MTNTQFTELMIELRALRGAVEALAMQGEPRDWAPSAGEPIAPENAARVLLEPDPAQPIAGIPAELQRLARNAIAGTSPARKPRRARK
jgi:hypothetical protein